jgi:signal transduction histidine kinase
MRGLARWWSSIAFRQALTYAVLVIITMAILLIIVYEESVGTWRSRVDRQIESTTHRLVEYYQRNGSDALAAHIASLLGDGIDSDTEVYTLIGADGRKVAGNLTVTANLTRPTPAIEDFPVERAGRPSHSRLSVSSLGDGALLVVGRDMQDLQAFDELMRRASLWGGLATIAMAIAGALLFRRQLEHRISAIRRTALEIERGDLAQRVPISLKDDEFARLSRDINAMLDRIHDLMEGVRHVSNTVAHNIRTPLSRVMARLDTARAAGDASTQVPLAVETAITEIQDINIVLDKLLRIAEVESGTRRQAFKALAVNAIAVDALDLYDALAETRGLTLSHTFAQNPTTNGDGDLLANAVANLLDNAVKYTPSGGRIHVETHSEGSQVSISVRDSGRGIPEAVRAQVGTRFFRVDRSVPGSGLGLASVRAIAHLHGGSLELLDGAPGLIARLILPASSPS